MNQEKNDYFRLLLLKARAGDNLSLEKLFEELKPMVTRIARGYFLNDRDLADLIQEGMIGLYKAFLNYDISSKNSFYSYAYTCVYRQIVSAVRNSLNQKNAPLNAYVSLTDLTVEDEDEDLSGEILFASEDLNPEEIFEIREQKREFVDKISQILSPTELKILKLYLNGKSYKEIAKLLDKNEKSIDNSLVKIKSKLKILEK